MYNFKINYRKKLSNPLVVILIVLFVIALAAAAYFYSQYLSLMNDSNARTLQEINSYVDKVGQLMVLPTGETPTIATVLDQDKLKQYDFYKNAQNGDKILIYVGAKTAIIYRPALNKIVNIAPVQLPTGLKVSISSNDANLTKQASANILSQIADAQLLDAGALVSKDYQQNQIMDLTGINGEAVTKLSTTLNAKVITAVPAGETKPKDADVWVLMAK